MMTFKAASKRNVTFMLFSLSVIILCLSLGSWQLTRAAQKQDLLNIVSFPLSSLQNVYKNNLHQKVILTGRFDNEHPILLDNQIDKGRIGFHLYLPFFSDQQAILVNLGWLPAMPSRTIFPDFPRFNGHFELQGTLSAEQGSPFLLGNNITQTTGWPLVVQRTTTSELQNYLNYPVKTLLLQLDASSNIGFNKSWKISVMSPEKHIAYAIQWFVLALAITICSCYWLKNAMLSVAETERNKKD